MRPYKTMFQGHFRCRIERSKWGSPPCSAAATPKARLIRIAIKSGELSPSMRAIAYLWLAETQTDPQQKRAGYSEALAADPNSAEARVGWRRC
ncbi:MAG: hypothetical protein U0521_22840 [Anaerolineae bacterium]